MNCLLNVPADIFQKKEPQFPTNKMQGMEPSRSRRYKLLVRAWESIPRSSGPQPGRYLAVFPEQYKSYTVQLFSLRTTKTAPECCYHCYLMFVDLLCISRASSNKNKIMCYSQVILYFKYYVFLLYDI